MAITTTVKDIRFQGDGTLEVDLALSGTVDDGEGHRMVLNQHRATVKIGDPGRKQERAPRGERRDPRQTSKI